MSDNPAPAAPEEQADLDQSAKQKQTALWIRFVRSTLLGYALIVVLMTVLQRNLMYHPRTATSLSAGLIQSVPDGVYDFQYQGADGQALNGWHYTRHLQPADSPEAVATELKQTPQVVLYFPGNAGNRSSRIDQCQMLAEWGADVLIADYRGFGDNPGSPTEDVLFEDAHALWNYVTQQCGVPHDRIVLFGESLGGGVAVRLAADESRAGTPPAGLVIRSSFSSMGDVGQTHYPFLPVKWVLWDQFDSESHICDINCRYLHLHGDQDEVVPYECGQRLYAAAPEECDKCFVTLEGAGHNDIYDSFKSSMTLQRELRTWLEGK